MKSRTLIIILLTLFACLSSTNLFSEDCPTVMLPEGTIIISEDTSLECTGTSHHYLICSGVNITFTDNSCFSTFYLEPSSSLTFTETGYGYSTVYAKDDSNLDANFVHFQDLYFSSEAIITDTASPSSPSNFHECDEVIFDYSLSGSCNESDPDCDDILLPAETIILSSDTTLQCVGTFHHYLICSGVNVTYNDNSCFSTFYLEPSSHLTFTETGYGYATVYAREGSYFDANFVQFESLYYSSEANILDTASPSSPFNSIHECDEMTFDYSLSGSCNETDIDCDDILLPAETIIISSDTTIVCDAIEDHYLICSGVNVEFSDNSCFDTFYLEPSASLTFTETGYGYSTVYARENSYLDANFVHFQYLYYSSNANIVDTASPSSPFNSVHECDEMTFDYSLSGSCGTANIENKPLIELDIYPNPAKELLYINISEDDVEFRMYDLTGSLVLKESTVNGVNTINIEHLSKGIYMLIFNLRNTSRTEKLIIN